MNVKQLVEWELERKSDTWPGLGSNPGRGGDKPPTNRLSRICLHVEGFKERCTSWVLWICRLMAVVYWRPTLAVLTCERHSVMNSHEWQKMYCRLFLADNKSDKLWMELAGVCVFISIWPCIFFTWTVPKTTSFMFTLLLFLSHSWIKQHVERVG
jgi:hypothetical protein